MTWPHRRTVLSVALLLALLALGSVQSALAVFGVVRRAAVRSWDSPATQLVEELALGVVPAADPRRAAADHLALARTRAGGVLAETDHSPATAPRAGDDSRAPPSA